MVTVTERAAAELLELLEANNVPPGQGVKLVPSGMGQIGMTIDTPAEGDEVIRRGDEPLLIVDSRLTGELEGVEIDCQTEVVDGTPRSQFLLRRPEG